MIDPPKFDRAAARQRAERLSDEELDARLLGEYPTPAISPADDLTHTTTSESEEDTLS